MNIMDGAPKGAQRVSTTINAKRGSMITPQTIPMMLIQSDTLETANSQFYSPTSVDTQNRIESDMNYYSKFNPGFFRKKIAFPSRCDSLGRRTYEMPIIYD